MTAERVVAASKVIAVAQREHPGPVTLHERACTARMGLPCNCTPVVVHAPARA